MLHVAKSNRGPNSGYWWTCSPIIKFMVGSACIRILVRNIMVSHPRFCLCLKAVSPFLPFSSRDHQICMMRQVHSYQLQNQTKSTSSLCKMHACMHANVYHLGKGIYIYTGFSNFPKSRKDIYKGSKLSIHVTVKVNDQHLPFSRDKG